MNSNERATLLMQFPFNAIPGPYRLRVEGNIYNIHGAISGTLFQNETEVAFSERFLTILIQTNQLVYNLEQMMKIRVILLTTELKPFADPVDVYILDSRGYVMKRWVSVYPYLGFVNLEFELPYDYQMGWWTIRVTALGQTEESKVLLERWFSHRFDVNVGTPTFIVNTEKALDVSLLANYTSVATVTGNATIKTYLRPLPKYRDQVRGDWNERYLEEYVDVFHGTYDLSISMDELKRLAEPLPLEHCQIQVEATVGERFQDFIVKAHAWVRVVNGSISLRFLGASPQIFKPGMVFKTNLAVSYHDLVPFPEEKLSSSFVTISPTAVIDGNHRSLPRDEFKFNGKGVLEFDMDTPPNAEKLIIRAYYEDRNDGSRAEAKLIVLPYYSQRNRYLQVVSSTKIAQAGEYAIFHVWANFYLKTFDYLVSSKGIILISGTQNVMGMLRSITTFSVPVSPEMAPVLHMIVYHTTAEGEVLADSVTLPVHAINKRQFVLDINMNQERSGNTIELVPRLTSETIVGVCGFDIDHISTHGRQQLTPTSILEAMYSFEKDYMKYQRVLWRDRDGAPETINYFTTPNLGRDTKQTFAFSDLVVFTNLNISTMPSYCNASLGWSECVSGQCYMSYKKCDGIKDCEDGTDEGDCFHLQLNEDKDLLEFYLYRRNRQGAFYDATAGNFAWKNKIIGEDQEEYIETTSPKGPSNYALIAVAMSKDYGLHIIPEPVIFDSTKPFFIIVESPDSAALGEQIGLRVTIINFQFIEIKAEVILAASDDYRFVQVEPLGIVSSHRPRTSGGELQHLVYVKPVSHLFVYVPIVATRTGDIDVIIIGRTQVAKDVSVTTINIVSDGVPVNLHTSLLLDMRNEAYLIKYLDVNVTEDPIIPFEQTYRRYIFGSPKASVTLIGDVVGVPLPGNPTSPVGLKALKVAEPVKSGEHIMFDFAYTLYNLIYLRLTYQLPPETLKGMLSYLNRAYVYQSVFYKNGAYAMFKGEQPSVWLTAYCTRIFHLAQYPDWENYLYIDPNLIVNSMEFLLRYQTADGSFYETTDRPWNRKMNPRAPGIYDGTVFRNVSLTAHVLITLATVSDIPGDLRLYVANARNLATKYLEKILPQLRDPYQLAIVTYALLKAGSVEAEVGFNKLDEIKKEKEGLVYWSPEPVPSAEILYQNQRPFILPRMPSKYDALAVEATAYALLVYIQYGGIVQDQIVKWLNTMRTTDEAFIASQDTIVAVEALIEYSFRTHVRDITNMKLRVESSSNAGQTQSMSITNDSLAKARKVPIQPNVWGHAEVVAQGSGLAVLQLDVEYNVDKDFLLVEPPVPSFDLRVKGYYHGRNKSHMHVSSCARWTLTSESETSGVAVVEISLPTGYFVHKPDLDDYVYSGRVPRLRRGRVYPKTAVFMFDYLDREWLCVNFTVQRWFPVANLTRFLKAKVYDYYTPERYKEVIYENYELFVLNICEVCGSYQCPYCPHFSFACRTDIQWYIILTILVAGHLIRQILKVQL